ncbi:ABC transporter ATP-binding protein [Streptomyces sp. NPDC026589]|uniref:ABC transporter ATP-binding protein n=1 Tax=Streptomyces sp. NPDC026589 TaxID=3155609 RepID=UPI0033E6014B
MGSADTAAGPLLDVAGLRVAFPGGRGRPEARVVRGVDLRLGRGECLAVVGESGSGKSVTARALLGLAGPGARVTAERLRISGRDLSGAGPAQWRAVRGTAVGMILQDALTSLDPLRTVGAEVAESLRNRWHSAPRRLLPAGRAVDGDVLERLREVRIPEPELRARQRPHELSGGLRQRALIASALASRPSVVIADEPTTALDVTVQAQILDLLAEQQADGTGVLLISHDLAVVSSVADRIAVMYRGVFVEEGPARRVLTDPAHPYTRLLLDAVPTRRPRGARLSLDPASTAGPAPGEERGPQAGCPFAARCPLADEECEVRLPEARELRGDRTVRCLHLDRELPRPTASPAPRTAPVASPRTVLEASGLALSYRSPDRSVRRVVDDVSFTLAAGETLAIVGESGSGKTTTAHLALGLLRPEAGEVRLLGEPWSALPEAARGPLRSRIQHVQQDPLGSFDPRWTVERVVSEAFGHPGRATVRRSRPRVAVLLESVGLDASLLRRRPAELSGGQRQRVAVARALASEPDVLVCDEPVSALDVSVQAQILDLFRSVQRRSGVAMLFISHDLGVVHHIADRVLVMRNGEVVESGPVEDVFGAPRHPYTRALLNALPRLPDPVGGPGRAAEGAPR